MLTLAYVTSRKDPKFEWWFDAITRQAKGNWENIRIVVVSSALWNKDYKEPFSAKLNQQPVMSIITPPKPCVWQGPDRLAKVDHWAAANSRNTALCLAPDGGIAYADDLSVPMPGWLDAAKESVEGNYIACGAYRKVNKMIVNNGEVESFEDYPRGKDHRLGLAVGTNPYPCTGSWLFGCSVAGPVDLFLKVGGWPEFCDSLKCEDSIMGLVMSNAGIHLKYDTRMMTWESEEHHHIEPAARSFDKGISPNDKSHAAVAIARQSVYFPNYNEGGIAQMRRDVLQGKPFPVILNPQHDWYDSQPLNEIG